MSKLKNKQKELTKKKKVIDTIMKPNTIDVI